MSDSWGCPRALGVRGTQGPGHRGACTISGRGQGAAGDARAYRARRPPLTSRSLNRHDGTELRLRRPLASRRVVRVVFRRSRSSGRLEGVIRRPVCMPLTFLALPATLPPDAGANVGLLGPDSPPLNCSQLHSDAACVIIAHMDTVSLGRRVAQAREDAGMTQDGLGRAVELDRSAISRLEKGERKLSVPELVQIATALGRPLSYFVADPVPAVVSRRSDRVHAHATTRQLDVELEQFSSDIRWLLEREFLPARERKIYHIPQDHAGAESSAASVRSQVSLGSGPIGDLGQACEDLGMYTFAASLGEGGADGGCVEVAHEPGIVGVAVLNGDVPAGRRRMTLAHELGHWIFGDAYDSEASIDSERMINSFAIHFLAPRAGVTKVWNERQSWAPRDRALAVGALFRLSWSAAIGQLRNLDLIDQRQHRSLTEHEPSYGDYLRLGLTWLEEFSSPYLSPSFTAAILNAYAAGHLTSARSLELLRGTLTAKDLPTRVVGSIEDLRRSFAGHDD